MEIEAKFSVPDEPTYRRLRGLRELAGFTVDPGRTVIDRDQYLDTADGRFLAASYACRLRREGDGYLITLKGMGGVGGAIHRRDEREIRLDAAETDPRRWPESPARSLAEEIAGGEPLKPLLALRQERAKRTVRDGGREVAEMSVDRVEAAAGDETRDGEHYYEIEIELKGEGRDDDLERLAGPLRDEWGLAPQPRSKFERALGALWSQPGNSAGPPQAGGQARRDEDAYPPAAPSANSPRDGPAAPLPAEGPIRAGPAAPRRSFWVRALQALRPRVFNRASRPGQAAAAPTSWAAASSGRNASNDLSQEAAAARGSDSRRAEADFVAAAPSAQTEPARQNQLFSDLRRPTWANGARPEKEDSPPTDGGTKASAAPLEPHPASREETGASSKQGPAWPEDNRMDEIVTGGQPEPEEYEDPAARSTQPGGQTALPRQNASPPEDRQTDAAASDEQPAQAGQEEIAWSPVWTAGDDEAPAGEVGAGPDNGSAEDSAAGSGEQPDRQDEAAAHSDHAAPGGAEKAAVQPAAEAPSGAQPAAEEPEPPAVGPDDPMSEAGRHIMLIHYRKMCENEEGTREGEDDESLHDMRVATRRLRAAYDIFCPYYEEKVFGRFIKGLKRTGRALGDVRDLDVLIKKAKDFAQERSGEHGGGDDGVLEPLLDAWRDQRKDARDKMLDYLDSGRYRRFKDGFGEFLTAEGEGAIEVAPGAPTPYRVCDLVPRLVMQRYEAVRSYEPVLEGAPLGTYHQLRIACKKLRYTLEFFKDVLGDPAPKLIKRVTEMQDLLGDLHDSVVAEGLVADFLAGQAHDRMTESRQPSLEGAALYLSAQWSIQRDLMSRFPDLWSGLISYNFRKDLSLAVAAL